MNTGRISLPSIDTMLDTTSTTIIHLEKTVHSTSGNHIYRSRPYQLQPYIPTTSTELRNHSRSFSVDSPSFQSTVEETLSSVRPRPSHEGSATSTLVPPSKTSVLSSPPSNHRRTVSTSYINTMSNGSHNTLNSLMDTPQRKYICHHCNKSFSRPSSLRTHIFSHTGEKPFACPYQHCDRTFSVQSNMRRHIRVHYSASLPQPKQHHLH